MKYTKKLTVSAMVIATLALSACSQNVPSDKDRVAGPNASASASASPSATLTPLPVGPASIAPVPEATDPTKAPLPEPGQEGGLSTKEAKDTTEFLKANPLNINIDYSLKTYKDAEVDKVFPAADFNVKEGVKYGLSLYQDLTSLQDFYEPRDTSKDFELVLPFAEQMTAELIEKTKKDIVTAGRYSGIPTADSKGSLGVTSKDDIDLNVAAVPQSFWNAPAISTAYDKKYGNVIRIGGKRTIGLVVESGETLEVQQTYVIDVVPSGEKQWLVSNLYWSFDSTEVLKK